MNTMRRTGGFRSVVFHLRRKLFGFTNRRYLPAESSPKLSTDRKHKTLIVYTVILSDYDQLRPLRCTAEVDQVCITDSPRECPPGWTLMNIAPESNDLVREARRFKILAHRLFSDYDYSIYLDGNMQLIADPYELVEKYLQNTDLVGLRHPERICTYQEAEMVKFLGLDSAEIVDTQMDRYRKTGFPEKQGLLETAVLLRRHGPSVDALNELWWKELSGGSCRDQLSLIYAAWQRNLAWQSIPGGRENNHIARFFPHLQEKRPLPVELTIE